MKRILLMVLRNFLYVPYGSIKLFYYAAHPDKYSEEEHYQMLRTICRHANKGGRITIEAEGEENIPPEGGFLFCPNHQGLYDPLAVAAVCPRSFSVVAKKEVGNVPFLKQALICMKGLLIDREDLRQSMQVILEIIKGVSEGRPYLIFAEGTRSKEKNQLQEFKGGCFKAATRTKCPIVPVALMNTKEIFDSGSIKPVTVKVCILKPMLYEEYGKMKTVEIAAEVKRRIEEKIAEKMEK